VLVPPLSSTFATRQRLSTCTAIAPGYGSRRKTAVKCADRNPRLIGQATKTLENALGREGMLD
jgi:hypothetical protein